MSGSRATLRNTAAFEESQATGYWGGGEAVSPLDALPLGVGADEKAIKEAVKKAERVVGGFGSAHTGVVNILFADGMVRAVGTGCDKKILKLLGDRADGEMVLKGPTRDR